MDTMTSDQIREARQRLSLSQAKLAKELGVTVGAVSRWECGKTIPHPYLRLALKWLAAETSLRGETSE